MSTDDILEEELAEGEYTEDIFWSDLFEEVHHDIKLGMNCTLLLKPDQLAEEQGWQGRWYYQIMCERPDAITGEMGVGYSKKEYLSPSMTRTELVHVATALMKGYWLHEAAEAFWYRAGSDSEYRQVYGPHIDVMAHYEIARWTEYRDER